MATDDEMNQSTNEPEESSNPSFEEVTVDQGGEQKPKTVRKDSYFDGGLLELIGWRLLGFLITVVTLGIAAPWAQCMLYSYQFKHTVYNGKRLKFEGTGGDLFVNIFKWIFFSIITFGIYILWIPVKKAKWVVSNLHYEDENFVQGESFFDGKTIQLIGINILSYLLTLVSFGILYPFTVCYKLRWIHRHSIINRKKLVFTGKALSLWGKYLLWGFLTIITFGIFSLWIPILQLKWQSKNVHIKVVGEQETPKDKTLWWAIPLAIIGVIVIGGGIFFLSQSVSTQAPWLSNLQTQIEQLMEGTSNARQRTSSETRIREIESMVETSTKANTKSSASATTTSSTPTKITIGGYSVALGTYTGQDALFDWEAQKEIKVNVKMVLGKNKITVDGKSLSYTVKGNEIIANGFPMYRVVGNNKIQSLAQSCPILTYQGN